MLREWSDRASRRPRRRRLFGTEFVLGALSVMVLAALAMGTAGYCLD